VSAYWQHSDFYLSLEKFSPALRQANAGAVCCSGSGNHAVMSASPMATMSALREGVAMAGTVRRKRKMWDGALASEVIAADQTALRVRRRT
jgi:hypothetical protein